MKLGELYCAQGKCDEARQVLHKALRHTRRALGNDHDQVSGILAALAHAEVLQEQWGAALVVLEEAQAILARIALEHPKAKVVAARISFCKSMLENSR
jgi:hypothetical protein